MSVHKIDLQSVSLVNRAFIENTTETAPNYLSAWPSLKEVMCAIRDLFKDLSHRGKIDMAVHEVKVKNHLEQTAFAVAKAGISKDEFVDFIKSEFTLKNCRPKPFDDLEGLYRWTGEAFDEALEKLNSKKQESVDDSDMDESNLPEESCVEDKEDTDPQVREYTFNFQKHQIDDDFEPSMNIYDKWELEMGESDRETQDQKLERYAKMEYYGLGRDFF